MTGEFTPGSDDEKAQTLEQLEDLVEQVRASFARQTVSLGLGIAAMGVFLARAVASLPRGGQPQFAKLLSVMRKEFESLHAKRNPDAGADSAPWLSNEDARALCLEAQPAERSSS